MSIFTGAGVAIVTPMKANGEINYDKLAELLDYQINNSTDAIVICGTTGESATMTEEEHVEAIRFTADYVKKRVPVVAGTGSNCTKTAVELSKEAQAAGVDACLVVTPYYNKASQKGLIEHYTTVAKSIDLPIIMYNVPSRTGCNIQPETAVKLAKEVDNIVAIKAVVNSQQYLITVNYSGRHIRMMRKMLLKIMQSLVISQQLRQAHMFSEIVR